ncbi:MAG: PAS domain-containing protein [Coriobacteriia bacterium]|nr:PAS domain-containing protein [Coriobacteriia bacterium]MBN2839368.1 PAS domain-containing protein [Coriobacteriia bacterium]
MNAITFVDALALLGYLGALILILATPGRARSVGSGLKYPLAAAIGLLVFVSLSNVLEHAGVSVALDAYEDYAEVLFVPLVAYILFSRTTVEQLAAAKSAREATRREHALLMNVVDTAPSGVMVADEDGRVWFANSEARSFVSAPTAGVSMMATEGLRPAVVRAVTTAPVRMARMRVDIDGEERWFSLSATPLAADGASSRQAVVAFQDISAQVASDHELEQYREDLEKQVDRRTGELLALNRQLQTANETGQRLLANISHELRTPLNSILGFTEIMLRETPGQLNDEQRRQLNFVQTSGRQLLGMVDSVLEVARGDAGRGAVAGAPIDLRESLAQVIAPLEVIAAERNITLSCSCPETVMLVTDADKLGQVVRNLATNAIKFTEPGGSVDVELEIGADEAVVRVADDGIGIDPGDQERIFEAFEQVVSEGRLRPSGVGLGLAICKELCDVLGYGLEVQSAPGEGSTFTVRIPYDVETADSASREDLA